MEDDNGEDEDTRSSVEIEIDNFIKTKRLERTKDPLLWWKHQAHLFPRMALFAKKILCIPATSVPSERVFSKAGELVSLKRSNLKKKKW